LYFSNIRQWEQKKGQVLISAISGNGFDDTGKICLNTRPDPFLHTVRGWFCMKKRLLPVFAGALSLMILYSCGTGAVQVKQERVHRTGIGAQERAVILLERYEYENRRADSEEKERELTDCLRSAMFLDGPLIETITGSDFRATVFPGLKFENAPRTPDALLDVMKKEDVQDRVSAMTVRYLIVVDIQTSARRSTFRATVLDAKNRAKSGTVSSDFTGRVGAGLPILSGTEREACAGLGKAVYKFIMSDGEPAPAKTQ